MGCCFGCLDISGSILTFNPSKLTREKGNVKNTYSGCLRMSLYSNRINYDGFPCCSCCCLCGCCRGVIAFNHIQKMQVTNDKNTKKVMSIMMDNGYEFRFGPLSTKECEIIQNTLKIITL